MCGTSPNLQLIPLYSGIALSNLSFFNLLVCYFIPRWIPQCAGLARTSNLSRCIAGLLYPTYLSSTYWYVILSPGGSRNVRDKPEPPTYPAVQRDCSIQSIFLQLIGMLFYPQVDPAMCGTSPNLQLIPLYSGIALSNLSFFNLLVCYFIPRWTRTTNLQLRRLLLYPIELWGLETYLVNNLIWTLSESNRLPPAYNPAILRDQPSENLTLNKSLVIHYPINVSRFFQIRLNFQSYFFIFTFQISNQL